MDDTGLTGLLCGLGASSTVVPDHVTDRAHGHLLTAVALSRSGTSDEGADPVVTAMLRGGAPLHPDPLLSGPDAASPVDRAQVTATRIRLTRRDPADAATGTTPTTPVIAAVLALAVLRPEQRSRCLPAIAIGTEVALSMADLLRDAGTPAGWDLTTLAGHLGAAVACGHLSGFTPPQIANVLGIAATQAVGAIVQEGTSLHAYRVGAAAGNAVEAALLTDLGFTGPSTVLEGRRGLLATVLGERGLDGGSSAALAGLGTRWRSDDLVTCEVPVSPFLARVPPLVRELATAGPGRTGPDRTGTDHLTVQLAPPCHARLVSHAGTLERDAAVLGRLLAPSTVDAGPAPVTTVFTADPALAPGDARVTRSPAGHGDGAEARTVPSRDHEVRHGDSLLPPDLVGAGRASLVEEIAAFLDPRPAPVSL